MLFYLALNERGHTMTPNKTPDQSPKPEWFEITENQTPSTGLRKVNKVLPIATLVVAGGLILGGSIFANANNESTSVTQSSTSEAVTASEALPSSTAVATTSATPPASKSTGVPTIAPQTSGAFPGGDREGHERRPRGEHPAGEDHPERPDHDDHDEDEDDD